MNKSIGVINNPGNKKNIEKLEAAGLEVIPISPVALEKNAEFKFSDVNLEDFDWLIFTDIFAVDFFMEELLENEFDPFDLDLYRICALGEATADRLRFSQIHADVVPQKLDPKKIAEEIKNYSASDNENHLRILIVKKEESETNLVGRLGEIGSEIVGLSVYSAKIENPLENLRLKTLLSGGAFDEIRFFSAEDLQMFRIVFDLENFAEISQFVRLKSPNEIIEKSIGELIF